MEQRKDTDAYQDAQLAYLGGRICPSVYEDRASVGISGSRRAVEGGPLVARLMSNVPSCLEKLCDG